MPEPSLKKSKRTAVTMVVPPSPPLAGPPSSEIFDAMLTRMTMGQREDFTKMLVRWMEVAPGVDQDPDATAALRTLARRFPDRFMQGLTMVARLAGVTTDRVEVTGSLSIAALVQELPKLSDAELYRRAREALGPAVAVPAVGGSAP